MSTKRLPPIVVLLALFALAACAGPGEEPRSAEPTATAVITSPQARASGELPESPPAAADASGPEVPVPSEYDIVTLLPRDAIPAIFDPQFVSGAAANSQYAPDELVLGVEFDGDARAYSIPFLSGHEIVNDMVAGRPIAVTW